MAKQAQASQRPTTMPSNAPRKKPTTPRKPKATTKVAPAPAKPVEPATPALVAIPAAGSRAYPAPTDILVPVTTMPKGLGADQRLRWDAIQAAYKKADEANEAFTAKYLSDNAPGGRRTLRRACRARLFVGWPSQGE